MPYRGWKQIMDFKRGKGGIPWRHWAPCGAYTCLLSRRHRWTKKLCKFLKHCKSVNATNGGVIMHAGATKASIVLP